MPVVGSRRVALSAFVLSILLLLALPGVAPVSAQSDPVMAVTAGSTYRPLVEEGRLEVAFEYTFENPTEDTSFPGFFESLPADAVEVTAVDRSGDLALIPGEPEDGFTTWLVAFRSPLDPGDSTEVTLRFALEPDDRRAAAPVLEPGAVAFDAYSPGPDHAEWTAPVFDLPEGFTSARLAAPERPYEIVRVEFVDPAAFASIDASLPPDLTISDWATDGAWSAAVLDRAQAVVGSLDNWFGPRSDPLEVRRTFVSDDHAAIGEDVVWLAAVDAESIDHQLAHAWLTDVPVDETWFLEGLAAAFAGDRPNPGGPAEIVPIIVDEIGAAGVREIVTALRSASITYPGVVGEPQPLPPDWRTLLDHLEGAVGADGVDELFREAVVDPADVAMLDRRAAARVDYEALEFRAGGWTLPPYLRAAMAAWEFDEFAARQGEVSDVIVRRDALHAWEDSLELTPRNDAEDLFEAAERDMDEVDELLDDQEAALEAFDEAEGLVNGDRGLLAAIGLLGHDPDGDLQALRDAWAEGDYARVEHDGHELASLVEGAVGDGTIRLLAPALGLIAVWQLVRLARRRLGGGGRPIEAEAAPAEVPSAQP